MLDGPAKRASMIETNAATQLACGAVTRLVTVFLAHPPTSHKACLDDDIFVASLAEMNRGSDRLQDMKKNGSSM